MFKFKFIQRFLAAWRLTRDAKLMATVQQALEDRAFHEGLMQRASKLTEFLLKREPSNYKPYEIVLQVKNVCSAEELLADAKTILEESRIENKPKLTNTGVQVESMDSWKEVNLALAKHNDKFK